MRFSCKVFIPRGTLIPADNRRYLLSLLKEALQVSSKDGKEFYDMFYSENETKPFTFSAYFPLRHDNNQSVLDGDFFTLYFSTNNYEFLMRVYNGLMAIKHQSDFTIFGAPLSEIKGFYLQPEKSFTQPSITFKTISPFLVRSGENGDKYLYPGNALIHTKDTNKNGERWKYWEKSEDFASALKTSLQSLIQHELPECSSDINITIQQPVVVPIFHGSGNADHAFKMTFPGIKGLITIQAAPEVLKLFYDIGIGARRSEGFGMLEVVG